MAPISHGTNSKHLSNSHVNEGADGASGSFDAPPSTMAAQLISNLSTNKIPARHVEQDELQKLMSEVSSQENNFAELSSNDAKLEHKHKLIYVFSRAVLERLKNDDPFMNVEQLVLQASEALDIFMSTIRETPDVLAYVLKSGSGLQTRGQEPLWIWLFPRILTLLGRQHCDSLTEKIKDFFYISFQAAARSPKLWNLTSFFFRYLKECSTAILSNLQTSSIKSHTQVLEVFVPAEKIDHLLFSYDKEPPLSVSPCNYIIQDASDGLWHATNILSMLVDISIDAAASHDATSAFQDYLAWMLDSFHTIHDIQKLWHKKQLLDRPGKRSDFVSLSLVHELLSSLRSSVSNTIIRKGYILLCLLCADIIEELADLSELSIGLSLCSSLLNLAAACKQHDSVRQAASVQLVPAIKGVLSNETIGMRAKESLYKDIQKAGSILCQVCRGDAPKEVNAIAFANFENADLDRESHLLGLDSFSHHEVENSHPSKRRKVHAESDLLSDITANLYSLLGSQQVADLVGLNRVAEACFSELSNVDQCTAIESLGRIPCAVSGSLTVTRSQDGTICASKCVVCEGIQLPDSLVSNEEMCLSVSTEAILTLSKLVKTTAFLNSKRPRVVAMVALRSFALHFNTPDLLDLEISSLGQWCLQSLQSSMRELRILAGRTLPVFLQGTAVAGELMRRNRFNVLGILRSLSEKDTVHLQETCVLAWAQVGRVLADEELNIVLLRLVEYLGHTNPLVSNVAFNEILKLARASGVTTERMFSAFWGSIAIVAVKDLIARPQTSQRMADLLEITVPDFLVLTQVHTLPWLVLNKKTEVINKISQARKHQEVWMTCTEPSNLIPILALLLIQNVPDTEAFIVSLLKNVSPRFEEIDFTELIRVEPASSALQLLKAAGEADESKKSRIRYALQFLVSRTSSSGEGNRKKNNPVGSFLGHHILGLVARLSEVVNDTRDEQSIPEKKRCVKAIEEMVKIGKEYTRTARPQICACLQSALAQKELQALAFSAWETMLINLDDEDVQMMLDSTFAIIIQRWGAFDDTTQKRAEAALQYLLKHRISLIREGIFNIPSLSQFPQLSHVEEQLNKLRTPASIGNAFQIFSRRVSHENAGVVAQALVELKAYLHHHQSFLQSSAVSEQPDVVVGVLVRSILDACVKFNESHHDIAQLSAECIGLIGCLDSNRVDSVREQREMVVVSNFQDPGETTDFVLFILEEVIVKAFLSATDTGLQGFLSFVMQELLEKCDFREVCGPILRNGDRGSKSEIYQKWLSLPTSVQATLTPFLSSKYSLRDMTRTKTEYPIFRPDSSRQDKMYNVWLKAFVLDLLQKPLNINAELIFEPLLRAIRIKDISIASFLLPYVVLHVILAGTDEQRQEIGEELLGVLRYEAAAESHARREDLKLCSEAVFRVIDYLSRWIQAKQVTVAKSRGQTSAEGEILRVTGVLSMIPAEVISRRAVECKSYSRALFYWEQHIRHVRERTNDSGTTPLLLERLQEIYTQIDEPDGIEGISAHLHVLDIDQQILGHRKAGRWTTAQSWYEIKLAEDPDDIDVQVNLLTCLEESGQHDVLLNYVEGMRTTTKTVSRLLPFATEASWATGRWLALDKYVSMAPDGAGEDFNLSIGRALLALHQKDTNSFTSTVRSLREQIACSLSISNTSSLRACHDNMLKFHVLTELEMIAGSAGGSAAAPDRANVVESLNRRIEVIGAYLNDKQYVLGIRRAAMQLSGLGFTKGDIASAWLTSARLARKGNAIHQSFNAVLHASQLGDDSATIEHARLLWREGHHRKAIQSLQSAIDNNAFISHNSNIQGTSLTGVDQSDQQNFVTARAHLLLAKWLDSAGQTHSTALRSQYQLAARTYLSWEKGHYYLGRHYNKLLESEKALAPELQAESYLIGETAKLVIENYLRSLSFGTKYIYQTLPRILTLWLDLGTQVSQALDPKYGNSKDFISKITNGRKEQLNLLHNRFSKYIVKMPAYIFYTALPQIVARIAHPNTEVYKFLQQIIFKVVAAHPQQALWSLLAVSTSTQTDRKQRGVTILQALRNNKKSETGTVDIKAMIRSGERLADQLLMVCNTGDFQGNRTAWANLSKDLGFNHKTCTPSPLSVPIESVLTATLPTLTDNLKAHKAFSRDVVTISSFLEEVLILSSLQKPRKLTARGSDGRNYGLLCKPKDDLRKDQRLMEFNSMINRSLKRDAESSTRQLYIKTYAVTPLNEECGIIEWVDGLKTLRDILLSLYKPLGITPNYREIEVFLDEAGKSESKLPFFTEKVLGQFPPVFHLWFVQQFPEPSAWFAARLRYTRSCAVMSMVGTILGLGDRHGENILFEEGNGGTFHVDFNCLFDKGLTFVKPEKVPFRLTHNMVDAMGIYGYEGPFRKSSELTLKLLRQHEETLMTILEAFVYDPTLDLLAKKPEKKKKDSGFVVPQTAQGVLNTIQRKVRGLLAGESVPLGVEGQVDELIKQATNLQFLAGMYIGWCAFF